MPFFKNKVEYHHLLVKARKFHGAVTAIENYELENGHKSRGAGEIRRHAVFSFFILHESFLRHPLSSHNHSLLSLLLRMGQKILRRLFPCCTDLFDFNLTNYLYIFLIRPGETGVAMTSLLADERGGLQADEMTFSNIAGVLPAVDKVSDWIFYCSTSNWKTVFFILISLEWYKWRPAISGCLE